MTNLPSRSSFIGALMLLLLAVSVIGCGKAGPKKYRVAGEVTWEGEPLPDGDILFEPVGGGIPDHGKIVAGKFDLQARPGAKKVKITATRAAGKVDPSMGMAPQIDYIPHRYNAQTKLEADVQPNDENHFDFPLTSQEPP